MILDFLQYGFMVRALIAGSLIALQAPIMGMFLVSKRYALMADSLAHVALTGVALGLLLGVYPLYTAIIISSLTALAIDALRTQKKVAGELALAMFLSGGLAVAVLLISLGHGYTADLLSYLFGSITTVTSDDIIGISFMSFILLGTIFLYYQQFVALCFDEELAALAGIRVRLLNGILMVLTATTVTLAMKTVGVLLIGALMVIPVASAIQLRQGFRQTIFWAIGYSLIAVWLGLLASFFLGLPAGAAIVVSALGLFGLTLLWN